MAHDFDLTPEEQAQLADVEPDAPQFGLATVPQNLIVQSVEDAALVVGAIQLRRTTAERIRRQAEAMAAQLERGAEWIERHYTLQLRALADRSLTGKTRSLKLLTGQSDKPARIGFRKSPQRLVIVDAEKAMQAAPNADFVQTKVESRPVAAKFKEHFEQTGEILPGCEVKPEEDVFYIGDLDCHNSK